MTIKEYFKLNWFNKLVITIAILIVMMLIFQAGVTVGYHKARFSNSWNKTIASDMDDQHSIFYPFMPDKDDRNPHGAIGEIVSIKIPSLMVKGPNNFEEIVIIGPETAIRSLHTQASTSDLVIGSHIIAIGSPDEQGAIHAAFIRIMPAPPSGSSPGPRSSGTTSPGMRLPNRINGFQP